MKKYLSLAIAVLISISTSMTFARKSVLPSQDFRNWSIAFNGGMSLFDGDVTSKTFTPNSYLNFAFQGSVRYMVNAMGGVFIQYSYLPVLGPKNPVNTDAPLYFKGISNALTVNGTVDFVSLFSLDYNKRYKWSFNLDFGIGVAFNNLRQFKSNDGKFYDEINHNKMASFVAPIGLSLEYTPVEDLGIFLQGNYNIYGSDKIEGIVDGKSIDLVEYVGIGIRYNFSNFLR